MNALPLEKSSKKGDQMGQSISSIVEQQVARWRQEQESLKARRMEAAVPRPVITISRELGSAGALIAKEISDRFQCELIGFSIIDEIAKKADYRKELLDAMDERTLSQIETWINAMLHGRLFDDVDYHRFLLEAVHSFTRMGSVVLLGRGSGFVPTLRPRINVRIVSDMENRLKRVMERENCSDKEAASKIKTSDSERKKFIKRLFDKDWSDPVNYDLVINSDSIGIPRAVSVIETAWLHYVTNA